MPVSCGKTSILEYEQVRSSLAKAEDCTQIADVEGRIGGVGRIHARQTSVNCLLQDNLVASEVGFGLIECSRVKVVVVPEIKIFAASTSSSARRTVRGTWTLR